MLSYNNLISSAVIPVVLAIISIGTPAAFKSHAILTRSSALPSALPSARPSSLPFFSPFSIPFSYPSRILNSRTSFPDIKLPYREVVSVNFEAFVIHDTFFLGQ